MKALDELRRLHEAATRDFNWSGGPEAAEQRTRLLDAIDEFGHEAIARFPALLRVVEAAKALTEAADALYIYAVRNMGRLPAGLGDLERTRKAVVQALADLEKQP